MKRRAFLASTAAMLPAAAMAVESDLEGPATHVKVTAEINNEGCLVITVGYPADCITTSYTVPVNQGQPHQTQIVFKPKVAPGLSKLSQVKEHGRAKSFFWLLAP